MLATVPVGSWPYGATYDAAKREVFVTNINSNNVSVINDTTDAVVATVPVGSEPSGAAYDAANGEVFVANDASNNVSVINDTTDMVVATVPVGSGPVGTAYDEARGDVFVANSFSDDVSVISTETAPSTTGFLGLLGSEGYYVLGGVGAAVVAVVAGVLLARRTRSKPPGTPSAPSPQDDLPPTGRP